MYEKRERQRGVILRLLDVSTICANATEQIGDGTVYESDYTPWAVAQTVDGLMFVICSEGVGSEVANETPLELNLYAKVENCITILHSFIVQLTPAEIEPHISDETIDLADLVRTFGPRLEDNFWLWYRRLAGLVVEV